MALSGKVYWNKHPRADHSTDGFQNEAGEGELVTHDHDIHGQACAVIETPDGEFVMIRWSQLHRKKQEI